MCPNTSQAGCHWDGSPRHRRHPRPLRVAATSPSRLLRAGQRSRCRHCGNLTDLYQRADQRPIALHPAELPAAHVPAACRWHLSSGSAHPHGDGSPWCRIPHTVLCPGSTPTARIGLHLQSVRRHLAVRTRRLIDTGTFAPASRTDNAPVASASEPAHAIVQMLLSRYLADSPLEHIRCVAQTRHRHRCRNPVLAPTDLNGVWRLLPTGSEGGQLALPGTQMAVYDLSHLPCTEQTRWRTQRCPALAVADGAADLSHLPCTEQTRWRTQRCPALAVADGAADLALVGWQIFDPLLHAAHIRAHLPHTPTRHPRNG
ncbi:DUF6083 domain-containing protein [Streptomyces sp. NPDC001848]|uniref:DUF6083 domain-containing protein n=1 Tax=Streptomyces sp. NPDC001848 TaxID=3364618 RepID=UPI0036953AC8